MTPSPLEQARNLVHFESESLIRAIAAGREIVDERGSLGPNMWNLIEARAERLIATLAELERAERGAS